MAENGNDDHSVHSAFHEPDAHGQAALLLTESILHSLVATSLFTTKQALDAVSVASEVKIEVATQLGESSAVMNKSLALLAHISASLKADI